MTNPTSPEPAVSPYRTAVQRAITLLGFSLVACALAAPHAVQAQQAVAAPQIVERVVGPYNVHVLLGGSGLSRPIPSTSEVLVPGGTLTFSLWVRMSANVPADTLFAGVGDSTAQDSLYLGLHGQHPAVRLGRGLLVQSPTTLPATGWHLLAAVVDGTRTQLWVDGKLAAQGTAPLGPLAPTLTMAPTGADPDVPEHTRPNLLTEEGYEHFGGDLALVTLTPAALAPPVLATLAKQPLQESLLRFDEASPAWPVQTRGQAGYLQQQDPSLLPASRAPLGKPVAKPLSRAQEPALVNLASNTWRVQNGWSLLPAPQTPATGESLSNVGFDTTAWLRATVPGTVLTTMVDRGVYPDPDFGLNNLAIPESLNKQDYWYRVEFDTPNATPTNHFALTFNGINYAAEVWLNGKRLGDIKGAFLRGTFDLTGTLKLQGRNALAVRISPPPHPGIPHEQSLAGGSGENGGAMELDGPTFLATEGWDWIPAIRDRNSGLWQDVVLTATGDLTLGDSQVLTKLPLPSIATADVTVRVPVNVSGTQSIDATLHASFEGTAIDKHLHLDPGRHTVTLAPAEFPQLHLSAPRLWWPNGYGKPELYHLKLTLEAGGVISDAKSSTFGVREVTYGLSLFDSAGRLRRVEVSPTQAKLLQQQVVDVTHEGMRHREAEFAAASLTPVGEHSPAVRSLENEAGLTDLVLNVNGVRIAARGGDWGMDDSRKRVSREHLEPFFKLHQQANLNIIRNWVGQDTEEVFYQLADEYGMMVWNDFWESTQDYNIEAQDVPLFLRNARDVVQRFRNHPSIVIWCGRNEGVPQPILNQGLIDLLQAEDGTRYYSPGSNRVNLRNSGPYHYQDPALYFSTLDKGFSVELGIASLSTIESLKASMAPADLWPISDAWAYHDFHWSGNGDTHPLIEAMTHQLGASDTLQDFERKSQMFNYVDHRAIFEGFNQHLWQPNSGRLLWMTQPAWPSNMWQIFTSDYDTNGSYYGVKKACEALHVQLDLSNGNVAAINTTQTDAGIVNVRASVYSLDNSLLFTRDMAVDLKANTATSAFALALAPLFQQNSVVLVRLTMTDNRGTELSRNLYWLAARDTDYRKLNALPPATVTASARSHREANETVVDLQLSNTGKAAALFLKATLKSAVNGERVLPAYFTDNYVSLLPGERQTIQIRGAMPGAMVISLAGWNLAQSTVSVMP